MTSFDADASGPDCFASARVLLATPDGNIRSVADNIAHPNGLAITSAHDLLVAETLGNRLLAFKIDSDGTLLHRKVFANFEGMSPLGICEDSEGAVWAAAARQSLFVRVQQGGRVTHRVHVPGRHAVACQLGGQDGRTLFCLTVAANLDDYPNRQQTARVEATAVDVPGAASSIRFRGNWLALAFRVGLVSRHPIEAQKAKDGTLGQADLGKNAIAICRWPSVSMSALRQGKVV